MVCGFVEAKSMFWQSSETNPCEWKQIGRIGRCPDLKDFRKLLGPIIVAGVIEPLSVDIPISLLNSVVTVVLVYITSPSSNINPPDSRLNISAHFRIQGFVNRTYAFIQTGNSNLTADITILPFREDSSIDVGIHAIHLPRKHVRSFL